MKGPPESFRRLSAGAVLLAGALTAAAEPATRPPNVVLVLADDLGWPRV